MRRRAARTRPSSTDSSFPCGARGGGRRPPPLAGRRFVVLGSGYNGLVGAPLPEDLSQLGDKDVARARVERDQRLTALFRRWPRLDRREQGELRRLHEERIRLARYVGRLRRRRRVDT
jgi:hypothetical protein